MSNRYVRPDLLYLLSNTVLELNLGRGVLVTYGTGRTSHVPEPLHPSTALQNISQ